MLFSNFLDLIKVLKMLYGRNVAEEVFAKNIDLYYDLNSESLKAQNQGDMQRGHSHHSIDN